MKFVTYKTVELENKKIGIELVCHGEKHVFMPEQIMAYFLKKVKMYFENAGMNNKEIVISMVFFFHIQRPGINFFTRLTFICGLWINLGIFLYGCGLIQESPGGFL